MVHPLVHNIYMLCCRTAIITATNMCILNILLIGNVSRSLLLFMVSSSTVILQKLIGSSCNWFYEHCFLRPPMVPLSSLLLHKLAQLEILSRLQYFWKILMNQSKLCLPIAPNQSHHSWWWRSVYWVSLCSPVTHTEYQVGTYYIKELNPNAIYKQ